MEQEEVVVVVVGLEKEDVERALCKSWRGGGSGKEAEGV